MKLSYYKQIIEKYRQIKKRDCFAELSASFPDVPLGTLISIVAQEHQRKVKKTYYFHAAPHKIADYYQRYLQKVEKSKRGCGFLLQIADEVDLSPALMAKLILDHHYNTILVQNSKEDNKVAESISKVKISELLRNTFLIQDKQLAAEVRMCILADRFYGSISDVIRNCIGQEHEIKLKEELTQLGFSFLDENQLRDKGYDKTPDIKLDIPIVVDGHIINWIESKASFGDEERHKEYLRDQYWSYCNRFGPGLVIYWSGYIEELNNCKEQGIVISDSIPTNITCMNPDILIKKTYAEKVL
ncbi:hypothetical protein JTE90_013319 [Oedothorax gibbosus]|uniref:CDAN1-interacting nuclease 1 n=1 Tax=Oedothorax gibbosus TaxID=931172 RepID=A0AAV6VFU3_9ARAC|nr:hypothetical protein JTE90_013319 [Oedothorax gibbosus]